MAFKKHLGVGGSPSEAKGSEAKPKAVRKNNGAPIIKDWVSNNEEDDVPHTKIEKKTFKPSFAKIEFVKPKQQEKTARKTVNHVEQNRQNIHTPRGNQRNWNNMMSQRLGSNFEMFNKACYVCGIFDHLQVDCRKVNQKQYQNTKPIWNNAQRVNHQNFAKKIHPCAKKNIVPRAVLMKSGLISDNTSRQVNVAHTKTTMNAARPMSCLSKTTHSTVKRPIHKNTAFKNNNFNQRVNTVKDKNVNIVRPKAVVNAAKPKAVVNAVKGNNVNVGNPQMDLQDQGVIDSGCSRHMTGNMSYLTDYEEIDGGYVSFGGNPKERKSQEKFKSSPDAGFKPSGNDEKKVTEKPGKEGDDPSKEDERDDQEKDASVNSTNNVNAASTNEVNVVGRKASIELPDEPNMPALEDIVYSDDDEDVGAEADMNNFGCIYASYASFKDFVVYQMDVKSAFLYGKIEEEVYVCQPLGFEDPDFPNRRGKIDKNFLSEGDKGELTFFLGLQVKQKEDGIFISQDKYVTEILKKFGFTDVKTASTPMETQKPLLKDEDGKEVDVHLYRLIWSIDVSYLFKT
ncbi:ribonuclease H-like domain-containing protein [Tanacetum coccineum]